MIGIIGAMEEEVEFFLNHVSELKEKRWKMFKYYTGKLFDSDVLIIKSGVGKVFSSMICQYIIDNYEIELILFTGVAGALNGNLSIGDVVVSYDSAFHDFDACSLGFKRGQIPYTNYRFFKSEEKLIDTWKRPYSNLIEIIDF